MNESSPALIPASLGEHTVENLYATHGPDRPWVYWLVLLGVIGALTSLPLLKVDVSVRAAGLICPVTVRTDLRPAASGHMMLRRDTRHQNSNRFAVKKSPSLNIRHLPLIAAFKITSMDRG